jgi:hypothetical protein
VILLTVFPRVKKQRRIHIFSKKEKKAMLHFIRQIICFALLTATLFTFPILTDAQSNRPQDEVTVEKTIRFKRGSISAVVSGQIRRGETHRYYVGAREGQRMAVVLKTGSKTSFTVYGQESGILDGADGVKQVVVRLPESGDFTIEIGTDATASYTLEVAIK